MSTRHWHQGDFVQNLSSRGAALGAVAIGMVLWWGASLLSGRREAWDGPVYWTLAYPLALAACAGLGYARPERPWRWALLLFEGQFVAMCVRNGELGNLWPLGMAVFTVVALPGVAAAQVAARLRMRAAGMSD